MEAKAKIRTTSALPFEVALVDTEERPVYQRIATKALYLRELGLIDRVIAQRLGVSDKTKAHPPPEENAVLPSDCSRAVRAR